MKQDQTLGNINDQTQVTLIKCGIIVPLSNLLSGLV